MKTYKTYLEEADEELRSLMVVVTNIEQHYRDNTVIVTHKFKQHDTGLIDVELSFQWDRCKIAHQFQISRRAESGFIMKQCVFGGISHRVETFLDITNNIDKIIFRTEANLTALLSWEAEH